MNLKISGADVLAAAKYLNDMSINALDLPPLTHNALTVGGVQTLADLVRADVSRIPGIGHGGLLAIRAKMAALGFTLNEQAYNGWFGEVPEPAQV